MNRKSVQKRKTHLEMLDSSSDSDVEILDYKPGMKRVRIAEPIPLLEDLANGNFEAGDQPIPEPNPEQNVEREHESLLATPEGSTSSSDNDIIEIDDASEDDVFHEENANVDESAIVISDSESESPSPQQLSPSSDEVIPKERFRPRISSENENQLILSDDISCGVERTPIRVVMDREAAEAVLAENSNLTPTEVSIEYRNLGDLYRILLLNKENTPDINDEEQQEIDEERNQLNFGSIPDQLRQIQGSFGFSYISTLIEIDLAKSRKNGIDEFPEEAFICCTCTDGCVTINCECKKVTWDDNRDFLDLKSKTLKKSKPKNLANFPYHNGRLLDSIQPDSNSQKAYIGTNIPYECNRKCACQKRENKKKNPCTNHVVQDGLKVRIEMFLTKKKGWGVRALEDIPNGTFIGVYIGEIRQSETNPGQDKGHLKERKLNRKYKRYVLQIEPIDDLQRKSMNWAQENGNNDGPNLDKLALITNQTPRDIHKIMNDGDFEPDLLPFHWHPQNSADYENKSKAEQMQIDMDFAYITNSYVYDSANHGSICRLFNHRCDDEKGPMLKWQYVHTVVQDQRLPNIAFFAQRDIKKGEEITWDYRLQTPDKKISERHLCHCESSTCRKYFIEYVPS